MGGEKPRWKIRNSKLAILKLILFNYVPHDQLNSNTIFKLQLFPFLIKLSKSNFLSAASARVIKPRALSVAMMSVAPPLSTLMFSPRTGGGGGLARPSPVTTRTAQLVPGSRGVNTSVTWGEITHCDTVVCHHQWRWALCLLWRAFVSISIYWSEENY